MELLEILETVRVEELTAQRQKMRETIDDCTRKIEVLDLCIRAAQVAQAVPSASSTVTADTPTEIKQRPIQPAARKAPRTDFAETTRALPVIAPETPETSMTYADRAKVYLEAAGPSTAMAIATGLNLPGTSTLLKLLAADSRFQKDPRGFWILKPKA